MIVDNKKPTLFQLEKSLGPLEEKVLSVVYRNNSPREVLQTLNKEKKYAYTTIMTVLDKLYKKGYLKRKKEKKTYYYSLVDNKEVLMKRSCLKSIIQLHHFTSPVNFIRYYFLAQFILLIELINKNNLIKGAIQSVVILSMLLFGLNTLFNLYLNGVFDYLFALVINPALFKFSYITSEAFKPDLLIVLFAIFGYFKVKSFSINNL